MIIARLYSRIGKPRFYDFTIFMIRREIRSLRANASGTVLTFIIPFYVAISTKVYLSGYRTERFLRFPLKVKHCNAVLIALIVTNNSCRRYKNL